MGDVQNKKEYTELYFQSDEDRLGDKGTLEHFIELDKTDEVISKCEDLFAKAFKFARDKGIPVSFLQITTFIGVIVTSEYEKRRMDFFEEYYNSSTTYDRDTINREYDKLMDDIDGNVSHDYVPVEFFLNTLFSGVEGADMDKYAYDNGIDISEMEDWMVKGIVNYNEFIRKMRNSGFTVGFSTYSETGSEDVSFDKLLSLLKSSGFDTSIDVVFDTRKAKQTMKQRRIYKKY